METHAEIKTLPDIGPKWEILPNQGRGSEPGSKIDIIRFDFFLLSAWEYNIPYHSALRKKVSLAQAVAVFLQYKAVILEFTLCKQLCYVLPKLHQGHHALNFQAAMQKYTEVGTFACHLTG